MSNSQSPAQTVTSRTMTTTCYKAGATFSGTVALFVPTVYHLTVTTSSVVGTIQIGQYISAVSGSTTTPNGISNGVYISQLISTTGSTTTWRLVGNSTTVSPAVPMRTYAIIPTSFDLVLNTTTSLFDTYYNASLRLGTGDRLLLYLYYTTATGAHDFSAQIDLF